MRPDRPVAPVRLTAVLLGVSVAALFVAVASSLSLGCDLPAAAETVRQTDAANDLTDTTYPDGNAIGGNHQHNDCLSRCVVVRGVPAAHD